MHLLRVPWSRGIHAHTQGRNKGRRNRGIKLSASLNHNNKSHSFLEALRVYISIARDFPVKKDLTEHLVQPDPAREKKTTKLDTNLPSHSSVRAAVGWEAHSLRKSEFSNLSAPAAHYVLSWVLKVMNLQPVFYGSRYFFQLFFLPRHRVGLQNRVMGTAGASAECFVRTF